MDSFSISQQGWIPKIMEVLKANKPCLVTVSGNDAILIVAKIGKVNESLKFLDFMKLPKINIGGEKIDVLVIPFFFGSLGSLGAAGVCLSYVLGAAHAKGYDITPSYDIGDLYDLLDDKLIFKLTKVGASNG